MTTREILEGARDMIRESGTWCQGEPHSPDGLAHCAWGAIITVERANGIWNNDCCRTPATMVLARTIEADAEGLGEGLGTVSHFNDTHAHAEVLEVFNLAIADEIAKEDATHRHTTEEAEREAVEDPAAPLVFA